MELEVQGVTKSYTKVKAVNNLSFTVETGEIFALLGPNGAGKSSLVKMLTGFTEPDEGAIKVSVDNESFNHIPGWALGYLPEDRGLYPQKTIIDNIVYFSQLNGMSKKDATQQAKVWLEKFDLQERENDLLKSLSKGNQQKVQLITAVIHSPKWVILDEPFSGLDPVNQEKVVQFLQELKALGMTVILSAHQMAMVEKIADHILLLNHGQQVFYGTLSEIKAQSNAQQVVASYHSTISQETLNTCLTNLEFSLVNETTVKIVGEGASDLNALSQKLTQLGQLASLQSEQLDLHQIYIQAIEGHGENVNEAA